MTAEEAAVVAANRVFYEALEARDLKRMEGVWLQEESASCIHPGWHRLDGWVEIRRSWQNIFANSRPWTVSCQDVRVWIAGRFAWVSCVEVITPFGAKGEESAARMQATNIFISGNGGWRMVHHHASASPSETEEEEEPVN